MIRIVLIRVRVRHLCESHKSKQQKAENRNGRDETGNGAASTAMLELESGQIRSFGGWGGETPLPESYKDWMLPAVNSERKMPRWSVAPVRRPLKRNPATARLVARIVADLKAVPLCAVA